MTIVRRTIPPVSRETRPRVTTTHPIPVLFRKRAWAMRRAETAEKALIRLVGNREYNNVFKRRNKYLQTVADLTLAIDALRRVEGKPVRLFGS